MKNFENLEILNLYFSSYKTRLSNKFRQRKSYQPANPGLIVSFIPGTVVDIFIKEGDSVRKGDILLVLDAMKMQNNLRCPADGKIKKIYAEPGKRVPKGELLIELE